MLQLKKNQPLSKYSTFGIGGNARLFVSVDSIESLQEALKYAHQNETAFHPLGKGSNSLFDDRGFDGLVIQNKISFLEVENESVYVGAGYSFALLGVKTAKKGLSGLEFASGIPAAVGGAIFMNAGAGGHETADVLKSVIFVDERGDICEYEKEEIEFFYRTSSFRKMKGVIAAARFELKLDPEARQKQLSIVDYRKKTQPYGEMSCGCVFRNPLGYGAGELIEKCGLKGKKVGGATVSTLHANFIVNNQNASARDVMMLANYVKEHVKQQTGIELEMELQAIPYQYELSS